VASHVLYKAVRKDEIKTSAGEDAVSAARVTDYRRKPRFLRARRLEVDNRYVPRSDRGPYPPVCGAAEIQYVHV
jgi:hypothetical protein